ncbi:Glucokinase [Streptococcus pasteurianus]|nr:Glucokinase [Streptococcus pasteurianus]
MTKQIIGIDLGGTSSVLAFITDKGDIAEKWDIPTNIEDGGSHIVPDIIESIRGKMVDLGLSDSDFIGIGMGSPGKVDAEEGTVIGAYNLNWSEPQEIEKAFKESFSLPFYIGNDANVAALGEQWKGAGQSSRDVVMFTIGTGVGGGIVTNGQLVTGFGGAAGEIGHLTVQLEESYSCTCGKIGCLEAVASATGIVKLAQNTLATSEVSSVLRDIEELSSKEIFDAAKKGDGLATEIVDKFCQYLGLAVSHVANTLSPRFIVVGGGVSAAGEFLREKITKFAYDYTFPQILTQTEIVLARACNDAGVIGAAQLVNLYR